MPRRRFSAAVREGDDVVAAVVVALATVAVALLGTRATLLAGEARDDWQRAAKRTVDQQHFFVLDTLVGYGAARAALAVSDQTEARVAVASSPRVSGIAVPPEIDRARPYMRKLGFFPVDPYVRDLDRVHAGPSRDLTFSDGDDAARLAIVDGVAALAAALSVAVAALASHAHRRRRLSAVASLLLVFAIGLGIGVEIAI